MLLSGMALAIWEQLFPFLSVRNFPNWGSVWPMLATGLLLWYTMYAVQRPSHDGFEHATTSPVWHVCFIPGIPVGS